MCIDILILLYICLYIPKYTLNTNLYREMNRLQQSRGRADANQNTLSLGVARQRLNKFSSNCLEFHCLMRICPLVKQCYKYQMVHINSDRRKNDSGARFIRTNEVHFILSARTHTHTHCAKSSRAKTIEIIQFPRPKIEGKVTNFQFNYYASAQQLW